MRGIRQEKFSKSSNGRNIFKLFLFADNILYIENPKIPPQKSEELISEFSVVVGHKIPMTFFRYKEKS